MKKTVFFVICNLLFLVSCDKLFVHISGIEADLQGKWQMDNADTVYYNFQNSLFLYQIYLQEKKISSVQGYYTLYGDTALDLRLLREYSSISSIIQNAVMLINILLSTIIKFLLILY